MKCETTVQNVSLRKQMVYSELVKSEDWNFRADGTQETINNVIGVPWRMTDGGWTVDRPELRVDTISKPPLPFEGARLQGDRIAKQDIVELVATVGCPGCNAIKDNKRAQAHPDRCRVRIEEGLRITHQGTERLDQRSEVISEALAEEIHREVSRGRKGVTKLQEQYENQNQQHKT